MASSLGEARGMRYHVLQRQSSPAASSAFPLSGPELFSATATTAAAKSLSSCPHQPTLDDL